MRVNRTIPLTGYRLFTVKSRPRPVGGSWACTYLQILGAEAGVTGCRPVPRNRSRPLADAAPDQEGWGRSDASSDQVAGLRTAYAEPDMTAINRDSVQRLVQALRLDPKVQRSVPVAGTSGQPGGRTT